MRRFLDLGKSRDDKLKRAQLGPLGGWEGERYRPKLVKVAVVADDGDEATTVANSTSDFTIFENVAKSKTGVVGRRTPMPRGALQAPRR